jgi:hypothetical protein
MQTLNIHALNGIRTQKPGFGASEDSACLSPRGYCDRRPSSYPTKIFYEFLIFPVRATYLAHTVILDLITEMM